MNYKIYGLQVKDSGNIRYVGYTKRTLEQRLYHHFFDVKQGFTYKKCEWIKKYEFNVEIILIEDKLDYKEALKKEVYWIKKLNTLESGMNMTGGGEENPMENPDTKAKHAKIMKEIGHKTSRFGEDNWMTSYKGRQWFKDNNPMHNEVARANHTKALLERRIVVDEEELYKEYITNKKTLKECAVIFDVSYHSIVRNLKRFSIKKYNYE